MRQQLPWRSLLGWAAAKYKALNRFPGPPGPVGDASMISLRPPHSRRSLLLFELPVATSVLSFKSKSRPRPAHRDR